MQRNADIGLFSKPSTFDTLEKIGKHYFSSFSDESENPALWAPFAIYPAWTCGAGVTSFYEFIKFAVWELFRVLPFQFSWPRAQYAKNTPESCSAWDNT